MPPVRLPLTDHTRREHASRIAANVRRARQRRAAGLQVLKVPVPQYEIAEFLIASNRLSIGEAIDPQRVAVACGQVLAELAERWSKV